MVFIAGALALLFAAVVGPRLIGVLLGLAAPPDAPLPDDIVLTLETHTNLAHGVDEWVYTTRQNVCDLMQYYQQQENSQCPLVPPQCAASSSQSPVIGEDIAYCYGDVEFSIFAMRWRFRVGAEDTRVDATRFRLSRVISWTGSLPAEAP